MRSSFPPGYGAGCKYLHRLRFGPARSVTACDSLIPGVGLPRCSRREKNLKSRYPMQIGTMNHPGRDVLKEIEWIAALGFDFVDLTLEPPFADARRVDAKAIRGVLDSNGLGVVGHTAYYLPLCSPFESIRRAALDELKVCLAAFATVGVKWMNIHPDRQAPLHDRKFIIERNLQTIRELVRNAQEFAIGIMIENLP